MKGNIILTETNGRRVVDIRNRFLAFKNNASFTNCISKINNVLIGNAEYLDVVMPMYNLIQYIKSYRKTARSFWNYYKDKPNNLPAANCNADPITISSFKYKTSITGKISNANQENGENTEQANTETKKNLEIVVPLKHLSNFWRTLDMPLFNCEVSRTLTWSENCVLTYIITQAARAAQGDIPARPAINAPTYATFQITHTKLYVPVVTLSNEIDKILLEQLRQD